jgi:hypothetical protein
MIVAVKISSASRVVDDGGAAVAVAVVDVDATDDGSSV